MVGGIGGAGGAGKPPGVGPVGGASPTEAAAPTGASAGAGEVARPFGEVHAEAAGKVGAVGEPLADLRAGAIDRATYVDRKVEEATRHLVGLLPPGEIERVQAELRDLIEQDPDVAALVKAAETARP